MQPVLLDDLRAVIQEARQQTARAVNSALVLMYWQIGRRIRQDVMGNERAEYGKQVVSALAAQLTEEYGKGFDKRNLHHMVRFAEQFPSEEIVNALRSQLLWTHFREPLFYHRRLRCLVVIELKLGQFQAADKGQLELYLLRLEDSGIRVAQYLTELPPKELLERKLHDSIQLARERLAATDGE